MAETKKKSNPSEAPAAPEAKTPAKRGRKPKAEKERLSAAPEAVEEAPVETVKESVVTAAPEKAPEKTAAPEKKGITYKVNAPSGLRLRTAPPKNTQAISGVGGGVIITVMPINSEFREFKRDKKWSYGVYEIEGKELTGWVCNQYLRK